MNPTQHPSATDEPCLAADFAQRVLHRADLLVARRRRAKRAIADAVLASAAAVAIVFGMRLFFSPTELTPASRPTYVALAETEATLAAGGNDQPDALSYMFPDAAPLARFDDGYSDVSYGAAADDALFAGTDENDEARLER